MVMAPVGEVEKGGFCRCIWEGGWVLHSWTFWLLVI